VYVAYNITGMTLVPKEHAILTADGNVSVTIREHQKHPYNVTYDCDTADAEILPPQKWETVHVRLLMSIVNIQLSLNTQIYELFNSTKSQIYDLTLSRLELLHIRTFKTLN
jgi:hypothetical protein